MFYEHFHQALIALLANYLQLRKRLGVPVLKIALENLLKGFYLVPTGIRSENVEVVVFIAASLFFFLSLLFAHLW